MRPRASLKSWLLPFLWLGSACGSEPSSQEDEVRREVSALVPTTVSLNDLCAKAEARAAAKDSGYLEDNCLFRYEMLKTELGDDGWLVFSVCELSAETSEDRDKCLEDAQEAPRDRNPSNAETPDAVCAHLLSLAEAAGDASAPSQEDCVGAMTGLEIKSDDWWGVYSSCLVASQDQDATKKCGEKANGATQSK
jgi:hypothetical protein